LFQLGDGQHRAGLAVAVAALGRVGEGGAGQLVHHLHHRADQPLDDPAEVQQSQRPILQRDPVLLAAPRS
jgi:hypothetical protein